MSAESFDPIGMGGSGLLGAVALGVALFLRQKFIDKSDKKKATETTTMEKPLMEWMRSFLEEMTEDRRELRVLFKEMAQEIREVNRGIGYLQQANGNVEHALSRIEGKADALLQRPFKGVQ